MQNARGVAEERTRTIKYCCFLSKIRFNFLVTTASHPSYTRTTHASIDDQFGGVPDGVGLSFISLGESRPSVLTAKLTDNKKVKVAGSRENMFYSRRADYFKVSLSHA